jgi:DNA-binding CsgD family transcriptional regulator
LATADHLLTQAQLAPEAHEHRRTEMLLRSGHILLRMFQGKWTGLQDEAATLLTEMGDHPSSRGDVEVAAGYLALARGYLDEASERLDSAIDLARQLPPAEAMSIAAASAARVSSARGDVAAALAYLDTMVDGLETKGVWPSACWALPSALETWVAVGRRADAAQFLERAEAALQDLDAPLSPAALRHSRGILTGSADDLVAAAELYDAVPAPYQTARAREGAAGRLLATAQHAAGETQLRQAVAIFEQMGAAWDRGRVARLARRYGVALPARHRGGRRGYGAGLSPRERQVAELAAAGRTNKEIAQELFLSTHTVAQHVAAVLRKVGARSRTELAHWVAAGQQR